MANGSGKLVGQYPELLGRRFAWAMDWTGPNGYANPTGDVVTLPGFQYYLDSIESGAAYSNSGNYYVRVWCKTTGNRASFALRWIQANGTEVVNGTDLSGETVRLSGLGGTY